MSKYTTFVFSSYEFSRDTGELALHYAYDSTLQFTERFRFDFEFSHYDEHALDVAIQHLFFIAGISYYKMYLASEIKIDAGNIDQELKEFLENTYQKGLGEFFYVNNLDPKFPIVFPQTNTQVYEPMEVSSEGLLVGIGGGKDSLVSVELLRNAGLDIATWSLNHKPQLKPLIQRVGLQHFWVERVLDSKIVELNKLDAFNGHVPISALFAAVGTVVGILTGRRDNIVSNEQSANEPTLVYREVAINHQYSKSQEFERQYQQLLRARFGDTQRYYSLLRPLSELRIAEIFANIGFAKYHDVFSSCNRAFTHESHHMFWDGTCAKCAFIFLVLTPFIPRSELETLFSGKNLLLDRTLEPTYRQLLGIEGEKPLECVGEIKESRAAMQQAFATYPELKEIYKFSLPEDFDWRSVASHEIPAEIYDILQTSLQNQPK